MSLDVYGTVALVRALALRPPSAHLASSGDAPAPIPVPSRQWGETVAATMGRVIATLRDVPGPGSSSGRGTLGTLDDVRG